jgi:hypothetical protein
MPTPHALSETLKVAIAANDWGIPVRTERTWQPVKALSAYTGQDPIFSVLPFGVESKRLDRATWSRFITLHVAVRGRAVTDADVDAMADLADAADGFLESFTTAGVVLMDAKASPLWDSKELNSNKLWFSVFELQFLRR